MIEIDLKNVDIKTKQKYEEFAKKVEESLTDYEKNDASGIEKVNQRMEQTKGNWDKGITLIDKNVRKIVPVSQLLAYEYCLATERITHGKVSFDDMLNKLFDGVQKFRIGNPVSGMDNECLYGKGFNDKSSIPVTTKQYRIKMSAGAQHLDYFKDGKKTSAVFIFAKQKIGNFAIDENGKTVAKITDGINFEHLSEKISLLTELRQTAFHEWNHNAEKENIQPLENPMEYEYDSIDGKKYRNYTIVSQYVSTDNINIQEPQYIFGTYINKDGKKVEGYYYVDSEGNKKDIIDFGLKKEQLKQELCFSSGLTTYEVESNGKTRIHNQITEGFVEVTAREMVLAVDGKTQDIDIEKYYEMVEMAKKVIISRDESVGEEGKTYADFLMHSSTLKRDLERKIVDEKVDGLHYISDYADIVHCGMTPKRKLYKAMGKITSRLGIDRNSSCARDIEEMEAFYKESLTTAEINKLKNLLMSGKTPEKDYVDSIIEELVTYTKEEKEFFDGISEKLGYRQKSNESKKSTQALGKETLEQQKDVVLLDKIEQEEQKLYIDKSKNSKDSNDLGEL